MIPINNHNPLYFDSIAPEPRGPENSHRTRGVGNPLGVRAAPRGMEYAPDAAGAAITWARSCDVNGDSCSLPKSSGRAARRHSGQSVGSSASKRLPEPQGQGSLRPSFSHNSLPPWTSRSPRLTWVSKGKPLRRLLVGSKAVGVLDVVVAVHGGTS